MAKYPALPLYTDAYLADTRHLTAAQHGAYLLLLMMAWRSPDCGLPDDERLLNKFSAMVEGEWRKNKHIVLEFFFLRDGRWYQKRLLDEREHAERIRCRNIAAGKSSALKRNNRHSTTVETTLNLISTIPIPIPNPVVVTKEVTTTPVSPKSKGTKNDGKIFSEYLADNPDALDTWRNWCAAQFGWSQERTEDALAVFVDYWTVGKGRSVRGTRWDSRARTWFNKEGAARSPGQARGGVHDKTAAAMRAVASHRYGGLRAGSGERGGGDSEAAGNDGARTPDYDF